MGIKKSLAVGSGPVSVLGTSLTDAFSVAIRFDVLKKCWMAALPRAAALLFL